MKCICGCEKEIKIQKHHKYYGTPKYIQGHNPSNLIYQNEETKNKIRETCIKKGLRPPIIYGRSPVNKGNRKYTTYCKRCQKNIRSSVKRIFCNNLCKMIYYKNDSQYSEKLRKSRFRYVKKIENLNGPNIGKNEKEIIDGIEISNNIKIIRQYPVCGFFVDGYNKEYKIAFEVDESFHKNRIKKDIERENIIKQKLNCQFLRICAQE